MLGIHGDALPVELASLMNGFDSEIRGSFVVCPFTTQKPGHMQFVCIESWRDIAVRQRTHAAWPKPATVKM